MAKKIGSKKKFTAQAGVTPHNHTKELTRLRRVKGQVEGVERMITDRRYCPEIIIQIKAIRSALKSLECSIIEGHMHHCVKAAVNSKDPKIIQGKIDEVIHLMKSQGY